jgi:hypothetical protein
MMRTWRSYLTENARMSCNMVRANDVRHDVVFVVHK